MKYLALLTLFLSVLVFSDDDEMIQIIQKNQSAVNGAVVELYVEQKDLPEIVQKKLEAGETITLVFNDDDKKVKHVVGLSLGLNAPLGGQIGITYSPAIASTGGKNLFEVTGSIGSALILTSYELGVNIRIPYVNIIYGHVGIQYAKSSGFLERKTSEIANQQIESFVNGIEDDDAREIAQGMKLGFEPNDFHFGMAGASFGVGIWWGPMRLEAGLNTMNVSGTANKLYNHLTGKLSNQIEEQMPPPPEQPPYIWQQAEYQQQLAAYNEAKAEYEAEKNAAITEGRTIMNESINGFLAKTPGGLLPYVKLSFVIPLFRK